MSKEEKIPLQSEESGAQQTKSTILDDGKATRDSQYKRAVISIGIFVFFAWVLGRWQYGLHWILALIVFVFLWWKCKISWLLELVCKDADIEGRRERAFNNTETVEWLNFIINRW